MFLVLFSSITMDGKAFSGHVITAEVCGQLQPETKSKNRFFQSNLLRNFVIYTSIVLVRFRPLNDVILLLCNIIISLIRRKDQRGKKRDATNT